MAEQIPPKGQEQARELARRLHEVRKASGLSQQRLATALGMSQASASRLELSPEAEERAKESGEPLGKLWTPDPEELAKIVELLDVSGADAAKLFGARDAIDHALFPSRATIMRDGGAIQKYVLALEQKSHTMDSFTPTVIQGALQTEAYMRAVFRTAFDNDAAEVRTQIRLQRRELLNSERQWTVVMTWGSLLWNFGGPAVMAEQMHSLADLDRSNVHVGVVDYTAGLSVEAMHGFEFYRASDGSEAMVGLTLGTATVLEGTGQFVELEKQWARLKAAATWGPAARDVFRRAAAMYEEII